MRKTCQAFAMVTCFGAFAACTDGEVGTNGRVRFSQSMAFADVEGLQAPIAVGRPLWITLQDAPANAYDEGVDNPRLALHVHRDGVLVHSPPRLNEVTHELVLDEPGSYELVAQLEAAELDRTSVRAAAVAGIGAARAYKTSTRAVEGGCLLHVSTGEGLSSFVLHRNQSLELLVVPRDAHATAPCWANRRRLSFASATPDTASPSRSPPQTRTPRRVAAAESLARGKIV